MKKVLYNGVKTNNLKNINVFLEENQINCLTGSSGSGKSSLAFETINQVSDNIFQKLNGKEIVNSNYEVDSYENVKISIPLKQSNYNKNPRSTIATYYGLDKQFSYLFSIINNVNPNLFSFNRYSTACPKCRGLGYEKKIDTSKLIDLNLKIKEMPFIPWKKSRVDYYKKILKKICEEKKIDEEKKFLDLSKDEQEFLIYGVGKSKIKISFKQSGRLRTKTDYFKGVYLDVESKLKKEPNQVKEYLENSVCSHCNGGRFNKRISKFKFLEKSLPELYLLSIEELKEWLDEISEDVLIKKFNLHNNINRITVFLDDLIGVKLGYLNLNRGITSLSGGELQRLRLSQILKSDFENLLFVLDEPLSSLHAEEVRKIENKIELLKEKNTFLIVEHNLEYIKKYKNIITLGESGGNQGGYKIKFKDYLTDIENSVIKKRIYKGNKVGWIENKGVVNNVKPFKINLLKETIIGVAGYSGSGKSTFLREILPKKLEKYKYISQKPINGNSYSTVASYLGILDDLKEYFAKEHKVDKSIFSYHFSGLGKCHVCNGKGEIEIELKLEEKIKYKCPECDGKRYNKEALSYLCQKLNIDDVLSLEVDEALNYFKNISRKALSKVLLLKKIGLNYLPLKQSVNSLSGGEAQRVKLLKILVNNSTIDYFGLDEPFQGLNEKEISLIMNFLYELIEEGKTIYLVEHNLCALKYSTYILEFGKYSGKNGGEIIYFGEIEKIKESSQSIIKKYLLG